MTFIRGWRGTQVLLRKAGGQLHALLHATRRTVGEFKPMPVRPWASSRFAQICMALLYALAGFFGHFGLAARRGSVSLLFVVGLISIGSPTSVKNPFVNDGVGGGSIGYRRSSATNYVTPSKPTPLRTRYVNATAGNDSNDGLTSGTAWKTTGKINSTAIAGDRFILTGTFNAANGSGKLGDVINNAGTLANPIQIVASSANAATLNGGDSSNYPSLWLTLQMQYWWFEDIQIANTAGYNGVDGTDVVNGSNNHTFVRVNFSSCAFHLKYSSGTCAYDCTNSGTVGTQAGNTGDGFFIDYGASNGKIIRWTSGAACWHSAGTISYHSSGEAECTDWIIAGCDFNNTTAAAGLILNGKATRVLVEDVICHNLSDTMTGSPAPESRCAFELEGTDITLRDFRVYGAYKEGVSLQARDDLFSFTSPCLRIHVHNGTIYNCGGTPFHYVVKGAGNGQNCTIENNIVWANQTVSGTQIPSLSADDGKYYQFIAYFPAASGGAGVWTTTNCHGWVVRNNFCAHGSGTSSWLYMDRAAGDGGAIGMTMATCQANYTGWASNNNSSDPLLNNPASADFSLQAGSPCIDAGHTVAAESWLSGDTAETYLGPAPDVGAYEKA